MNGMKRIQLNIGLACLAALLAGCLGQEQTFSSNTPAQNTNQAAAPTNASPSATSAAADSERQEFQVRGVVKEIEPADSRIVITHEEIPNYMPAMTMPFHVKDTNELAEITSGDQVTFTMIVTEDDGWIENLEKIGVADPTTQQPERRNYRLVREVEPLEVGDPMPNYTFTNSLGQKVELADYKGQAYAFTFIFTRCPFPTFCPRMNSNFEQAYEQLTSMPNAPTNWHLFSISFDTEFDTPEQLKAYSAKYNPDPKKWDFLTGALIDIDAITEQVGLGFAYREGTFDHNLRTVIVDASGKIQQIIIGNEWPVEELVNGLIKGAKVEPASAETPPEN